MLKVGHLKVTYGPIPGVADVSLAVPSEGFVAVLGVNGAGKSTMLRAISGLETAEGEVIWGDTVLLRRGLGIPRHEHIKLRPDEIVKQGIVQVPEGRRTFMDLTVEENLVVGSYTRPGSERRDGFDLVYRCFPVLHEKRDRLGSTLSGGEQRMLSIGRALMARPRLLMLDEPSNGLSPKLVDHLFSTLVRLNTELPCAMLVVEQNAVAALRVAQYAYVLKAPGHIILEGEAAKLREMPSLRQAYLPSQATTQVSS